MELIATNIYLVYLTEFVEQFILMSMYCEYKYNILNEFVNPTLIMSASKQPCVNSADGTSLQQHSLINVA